ncbi:HD-GYP domain-containing protein [Fundidesulfovibrio soli]|uniref:HD-GYP domain-containing protein n=1 Tax=Fundidesulfovibrio soli TaxID=2922716 RepID=UPI001FAED873|nr:HD-GYP domain-containing protein [Fundidesulfovibrio soli]
MSKWIPLEELKPGMFVSSFDLSWFRHPFVSSRLGVIRDQRLIDELQRLGVRHVQIDPALGSKVGGTAGGASQSPPDAFEHTTEGFGPPPRFDSPQLRSEAPAAAPGLPPVPPPTDPARTARFARKLFDHAMRSTRKLTRGVVGGEQLDVDELKALVGHLIASVHTNEDVLHNLLQLKAFDDYTYTHSVNLAALGVLLGEAMQLDRKALEIVGLAGILHDVGKCLVPKELIAKPDKLTQEEFEVVKQHSRLGHDHLKAQKGVDPLVLRATLEHHERMDGSGYPRGLTGGAIHPHSYLVSIVDVYDAITSERVYSGRVSGHTAIRALFNMRDKAFPRDMVDMFIKRMGVFPANSVVQLRNGCYAVVSRQIEGSPLHPEVIVICDANRVPVPRRRVNTRRLCEEMGRKEFEIERNVEPEEMTCPFLTQGGA